MSFSSPDRPATGGLRRVLGFGFGLAVIVGATLGIGILRTPGLVAGQISSPAGILAVWIIGGLYTLVGASCFSELGTMLPEEGGYYVYAHHAFGDDVGFAVGWTDWLTYCSVLGYVSIGMAEFVGVLVPALAGSVSATAVSILVGLVALQWLGVRVSSGFQQATTAIKFAAFLLVVVAAFTIGHRAPASTAGASNASLRGLVIALQAVVITYGGWQSALYFSEEDRDPRRNIPRSMMGGVAAVIVVYLAINIALLWILPVPDLARSTLPAADAARILIGPAGQQAITILSIISLPPMLNAIIMLAPRILFAMGRDGLLWQRTAAITDRGTPVVATLVTTVVAVGLIVTGTFQRLVAITAFFLALNYAICCVALVVLRRREPDRERPFRAWGYPWSAGIVLVGAVGLLAGTLAGDTANGVGALALLAIGILGRFIVQSMAVKSQRAR